MRSLLGSLIRTTAPTTTPVPLARDGVGMARMFGHATNRDRDAQMAAAETNGLLWSIVNKTSTALASVDWHLYRDTPQRDVTTERVEVFQHAVLDLLNKPNPFMSRYGLFETTQQHIDLTGEGYWVVAKAPRMNLPLELWPIMPTRMEPVPSSTRFLAGWMYTGPSGEQIPLQVDEVIQFKMPHPRDPYRGLGPVQAMLTELDSYRYSVEWNRNFFLNSAQPAGVIQFNTHLSDDEWTEFVERWNEQHKGVQRAHRIAAIEGATWATTTMSMVDMQFAELQTNYRDRLLEAFGMAGSMIGVTEDVNRANAEAAKAQFAEYLTSPRAVRFRDQINACLLPMYGDTTPDLDMDFDSPVPADQELVNATLAAQAAATLSLITAGFRPQDVTDAVGLPRMEYVGPPAGLTAPTPPPGGTKPPPPPADRIPALPAPDRPALPAPRAAAPQDTPPGQQPFDPNQVDLTAVDEQWQAALTALVTAYIAHIVVAQRADLLDKIKEIVKSGKLERFGQLSTDSADGSKMILDAMAALATTAAEQVVTEGIRQGVHLNPRTPTDAELGALADTAAALLAQELAVSAGREAARVTTSDSTPGQVADDVATFLGSLSDAGPTQHLGGALSASQNKARLQTYRHGPIGSLYAVEVLDTNTCGPCEAINGRFIGNTTDDRIVPEVEALYPNGGYIGCLGRDRCRGTITGVWRPETTKET